MITDNNQCLIWADGHEATVYRPGYTANVLNSERAGGSYEITREAELFVGELSVTEKAKLTTWLIDQRLQGVEAPTLSRATVAHALQRPDLPAHRRADRLLRLMAQLTTTIGDDVRIAHTDPTALAWSESVGGTEIDYFVRYLESQGWIQGSHMGNGSFFGFVTVDGYGHIAEQAVNVDSTQAFVAMWFDASMIEPFEEGIKPAIEIAGYKAFKINDKPDVDKIDDEIIGEIRRSRLLVADFTHGSSGARGGVYYEAGFAYGLGLPVVRSCRKDIIDKNELHFDVRQHYHVVWETAYELRDGLEKRIRALVGEGPNINPV